MMQESHHAVEAGLTASLVVLAFLYYRNSAGSSSKALKDAKFDPGDGYGDKQKVATGLLTDLKAIGLKVAHQDLQTMLKVAFSKVKSLPDDDKQMTTEKLIAMAVSLPQDSANRVKLTDTLITGLWDSLQHPPLSYMGNQFQYRTADGSYNNVLMPRMGAAGTPYAKTVRSDKKLHAVKPDPGLLFDMLMARDEGCFKENPAGISSMLFYHATIIVHDIFRTNRLDQNISDTSSYLDLAPLYGSSVEDQMEIRTMEKGLLKPDTFSEKRLLAQPPGVNAILVMYSRFHNYCADILLKINEGGRFSIPKETTGADLKNAIAKQDNDLFQTARLIVGGLYMQISLHDYIRGITNTHHSNSSWTLDPRVEMEKPTHFDSSGAPRGIGNQVSAEFNLLYRFHSAISLRDEKWLNDFFKSLFPDLKTPISELTPRDLLTGLMKFDQMTPKDPSKREFGGLKRGADGKFSDADLVKVLKESMEDPAGCFGARMVPKLLRVVEILGILQARKWQVASLNEFRAFFNLKRHETMEDVNSDPAIADILRNLYDHPDMIELYPGLFIEETKKRMDPGVGICPPYTIGRAVLSDAVTLIRSDRFYTIDYTVSTLTAWGMQEVQFDLKTMGGSMFYKLIQRAVPGWFPYNSLHIMQPMYTKAMNQKIATEIGTIDQFTTKDPSPPRPAVIVKKHSTILKVLKDQRSFIVPWLPGLNDLFPGKKDFSHYMLGGDKPANTAQRNLVGDIIYGPAEIKQLLTSFINSVGKSCLKAESFMLGKTIHQIDIVRDVAIPLITRMQADLFFLDLQSPENPGGTLNVPELYKHLMNVRIWGFFNNDAGLAWNRRRWAQESTTVLMNTTERLVTMVANETKPAGLLQSLISSFKADTRKDATKEGTLRWYGKHIVRELLHAGLPIDKVSDISWLTSLAGTGVSVGVFCEVLQFFFKPENMELWARLQDLAAADNAGADKDIRQFVLEAQRLTSVQRNARVCAESITIDGQVFSKGDQVVSLLGLACMDPDVVPNPKEFKLGRPASVYIHYGAGPHECLGKEVAIAYICGLVKLVAGLKNLRPAPGDMGVLKSIMVGTERCYLNETWSWMTFDPTTWKLHFDGYGKGVYEPPKVPVTEGRNLNAISTVLAHQLEDGPLKGPSTTAVSPAAPPPIAVDPTVKPKPAEPIVPGSAPNPAEPTPTPGGIIQPVPSTVAPTTLGATNAEPISLPNGKPVMPSMATTKPSEFSEVIRWGLVHRENSKGLPYENSEDIKFEKPHAKPPRIFMGLTKVDISVQTNPRIVASAENVTTEGFRMKINTWCDTVLRDVWAVYLEIPDTEQYSEYQVGTLNISTDHVWNAPKPVTKLTVKFDKPYKSTPKLVVWLNGWDMDANSRSGLSFSPTEVTTTGFSVDVAPIGNVNLYAGLAAWLAFPADSKGLIDGSFSLTDKGPICPTGYDPTGTLSRVEFNGPQRFGCYNDTKITDTGGWYIPQTEDTKLVDCLGTCLYIPHADVLEDIMAHTRGLSNGQTNGSTNGMINGVSGHTSPVAPEAKALVKVGCFTTKNAKNGSELDYKFTTSYTKPPRIFLGLNKVDVPVHGVNPRLFATAQDVTKDGFRVSIKAGSGTKSFEASCVWLEIPDTEEYAEVRTGSFSTLDDHPWNEPKLSTPHRITFDKPYASNPRIVVWMTSFDFPQNPVAEIKCHVTEVDTNGFVLNIDTIPGCQLYAGGAQWLAFPSDGNFEIDCGTIGTTGTPPNAVKDVVYTAHSHQPEDSDCYAVAAFSELHFLQGDAFRLDMRIDKATTSKAEYTIETWDNTVLGTAFGNYVSMPAKAGDPTVRYMPHKEI